LSGGYISDRASAVSNPYDDRTTGSVKVSAT
jgi:hypothetical protein